MSSKLMRETRITAAEYCAMRPLGRNGSPMRLPTAYRHMKHGLRGIKLEHIFIGGVLYTSVEAVERFWRRVDRARKTSV